MSEVAGEGLELLREILNAWFEPVPVGAGDLVLTGADSLANLGLELGTEVSVAGYLTHVSPIHRGGPGREGDLDMSFTLDIGPGEGADGLVCKLTNATAAQKALLDALVGSDELIAVEGVFRIWLERPRPTDRPPHIFDLNPVRRVVLPGGGEFPALVIDSPLRERWQQCEAVRSDFPYHRFHEPPVLASFNGYDLTFSPGERVESVHVAMRGEFGRIAGGPFPEGRPYVFHLQVPAGRRPANVVAVAVPDTPAYDECRRLHDSPDPAALLAVGLRSLHIPKLFDADGRYEIILCPVYRLESR